MKNNDNPLLIEGATWEGSQVYMDNPHGRDNDWVKIVCKKYINGFNAPLGVKLYMLSGILKDPVDRSKTPVFCKECGAKKSEASYE